MWVRFIRVGHWAPFLGEVLIGLVADGAYHLGDRRCVEHREQITDRCRIDHARAHDHQIYPVIDTVLGFCKGSATRVAKPLCSNYKACALLALIPKICRL